MNRRKNPQTFPQTRARYLLNTSHPEWVSFSQLIQDLMGGAIRRHMFSQWELDLLLDLQLLRLRKSSRTNALRRYLRVVQTQRAQGAVTPPRLSRFMAAETLQRAAAGGSA
jgi:hypothetical protein